MDAPARRLPSMMELRAYHEAGHAVAALLRGFSLTTVTISRRGRVGGSCEYRYCGPRPGSRAARRRLARAGTAVALAGSVAQEAIAAERGYVAVDRRTGLPLRPFAPGAEDDARVARRFARMACRSKAAQRTFIARMRATTESLILRPECWAAVRGLARALMRKRTLCGQHALQSVLRAVAASEPQRPPRRRDRRSSHTDQRRGTA